MIQVERLTKKFQTYTALNQISVSVQPGSVFGLVGSNGAGKSTECRYFYACRAFRAYF